MIDETATMQYNTSNKTHVLKINVKYVIVI